MVLSFCNNYILELIRLCVLKSRNNEDYDNDTIKIFRSISLKNW